MVANPSSRFSCNEIATWEPTDLLRTQTPTLWVSKNWLVDWLIDRAKKFNWWRHISIDQTTFRWAQRSEKSSSCANRSESVSSTSRRTNGRLTGAKMATWRKFGCRAGGEGGRLSKACWRKKAGFSKNSIAVTGFKQRSLAVSNVGTASQWNRWLTVWRGKRLFGQMAVFERQIFWRYSGLTMSSKSFWIFLPTVHDRDRESDQTVSPASLKRLAYWQAGDEGADRPEAPAPVTHAVPLSFAFSSDRIR